MHIPIHSAHFLNKNGPFSFLYSICHRHIISIVMDLLRSRAGAVIDLSQITDI